MPVSFACQIPPPSLSPYVISRSLSRALSHLLLHMFGLAPLCHFSYILQDHLSSLSCQALGPKLKTSDSQPVCCGCLEGGAFIISAIGVCEPLAGNVMCLVNCLKKPDGVL